MTVTVDGDFGHLVIEREMIDVTSALPYPSETWRATDINGHEHYRENGEYPTLNYVIDSVETWFCADCNEEHTDTTGHYECRLCGEIVEPGMTVDTHRRYAPGRTFATLNGEPIGMERAEHILAKLRESRNS